MSTVVQFPERAASDTLSEIVTAEIDVLMARTRINRKRINQIQLAAWLGIAASQVSARMHGNARWSLEDVDKIAEGFGVHPAVLLGGNEEGPRRNAEDLPIVQFVRHQGLEPRTRWLTTPDGVAHLLPAVELVAEDGPR